MGFHREVNVISMVMKNMIFIVISWDITLRQ